MINLLKAFLVLATSASLSLSVPQGTIPVGEEARVIINVSSGGRETLGTDAVITFNPKIISATKVRSGKVYPNYPPNLTDIDNVHGKVRFSGTVGFGQPKTAEGVLGEVFFRAKRVGTTKISFAWEKGGTDDANIVPNFGGLDLLMEAPKEAEIFVKSASFGEKISALVKRVLSFDYLRL